MEPDEEPDRYANGDVDSSYAGKRIVPMDGEIVASDWRLDTIMDGVRKRYPGKIPFVRKVLETGNIMV